MVNKKNEKDVFAMTTLQNIRNQIASLQINQKNNRDNLNLLNKRLNNFEEQLISIYNEIEKFASQRQGVKE